MNSFVMEKFNPEKHDVLQVAALIYAADREFNNIIYGSEDKGAEAIKKMMQMEYNYFTYPHVNCAVYNNEVVGVLVGFEGKEKRALDQASGKAFARVFGLWSFLKKMPTFISIAGISWKNIDDDGYLVNSLCVAPTRRGQGFGTRILETVFQKYDRVYLDVNIKNDNGLMFYQGLGFQIKSKNTTMFKGKNIGLYSLLKEK